MLIASTAYQSYISSKTLAGSQKHTEGLSALGGKDAKATGQLQSQERFSRSNAKKTDWSMCLLCQRKMKRQLRVCDLIAMDVVYV